MSHSKQTFLHYVHITFCKYTFHISSVYYNTLNYSLNTTEIFRKFQIFKNYVVQFDSSLKKICNGHFKLEYFRICDIKKSVEQSFACILYRKIGSKWYHFHTDVTVHCWTLVLLYSLCQIDRILRYNTRSECGYSNSRIQFQILHGQLPI